MHHRQERDAAIQHGTMTVIRASALRAVSGWEPACVCEDSELGLRLVQQGLRLVYVDEVLGSGLVPTDFAAYQRQRRRWAQGAMQILRRHRQALFGRSPAHLSLAQRYHFVAGWLPWVGDGLHLFFSLAAMLWTLGVLLAPETFGLPIAIFVVPLAVFFVIRLLLTPLLYRRRVPCSPADVAGAALAGIGLSHSVARGVFTGLLSNSAVFAVTRKGVGNGPRNGVCTSVGQEIALLAGLLLCIATLGWQPSAESDLARWGWMLALGLQALPYAAAVLCASLPTQYRSKKWMPPSPHPLTTKSDTGDS